MSKSVLESVSEIVAEKLRSDVANITAETKLVEDLGADSLDTVEIVMAIEEAFGIEIDNDEAQKMSTIADVVAYIEAHKA